MPFAARLLATLLTFSLFSSLSFASAIVTGFDLTSDGRNDDGTYTTGGCDNPVDGGTCSGTDVPIGFSVNFFGNINNALFINTNGNVTFNAPLSAFNPFGLNDGFSQVIAPYFSDVDTRNPSSGVVSFGAGVFGGRPAFGVNWINVGYFQMQAAKTNSFQMLLVDRSDTGADNFDLIFNYDKVEWEAGDGSFGIDGLGGLSAVAGFSDGTGNPANTVELPGSFVPGSFIDGGTNALITHRLNSDVDGRYIFSVRDGAVIEAVPEPASFVLLLAGAAALFFYRRAVEARPH